MKKRSAVPLGLLFVFALILCGVSLVTHPSQNAGVQAAEPPSNAPPGKAAPNLIGALTPDQALEYMKTTENLVIVETREPQYIQGGFIGAIFIPHTEMAERYNEIPANRPVILHCGGGVAVPAAYRVLAEKRPDIPELSYIAGSPLFDAYNPWLQKFNFQTKTVRLNSGYDMPLAGLGTYALSDEECFNSVTALLEAGGRLIDTAYMYRNEAGVGRAVRASAVPREEIFVTTKLYPSQFDNAGAAIDEALKKLDIGYIDMMLLHHPGPGGVKVYKEMERAVAAGKIRSIGLSNWYVKELEEFLPQITITPALVQNEIHPYYQENDVIPYIRNLGIVVQGWFPFGGRGHAAVLFADEVIAGIAKARNRTPAQVILRWNLQKGVVVIPGSSNPAHIRENLDIFDFELNDEEMKQINALDRNEKYEWY